MPPPRLTRHAPRTGHTTVFNCVCANRRDVLVHKRPSLDSSPCLTLQPWQIATTDSGRNGRRALLGTRHLASGTTTAASCLAEAVLCRSGCAGAGILNAPCYFDDRNHVPAQTATATAVSQKALGRRDEATPRVGRPSHMALSHWLAYQTASLPASLLSCLCARRARNRIQGISAQCSTTCWTSR